MHYTNLKSKFNYDLLKFILSTKNFEYLLFFSKLTMNEKSQHNKM